MGTQSVHAITVTDGHRGSMTDEHACTWPGVVSAAVGYLDGFDRISPLHLVLGWSRYTSGSSRSPALLYRVLVAIGTTSTSLGICPLLMYL